MGDYSESRRLSFKFRPRVSRPPWSTCVIVHFHMLHPMALSSPETLYRSELSTHCARGLHSWSTVISTADWTAGHPHVAGHQVERSWPCILAITERIVNRSQSPPHVSERITRRSSEWCHVMFALWQECAADQGTSLLNWCFTGNLHSS